MSHWKNQRKLERSNQLGAKLARRFVRLTAQIASLPDDAREAFDRVVDGVVPWLGGEQQAESQPTSPEHRPPRLRRESDGGSPN